MTSLFAVFVACSIQMDSAELQADFPSMVVEIAASFELKTRRLPAAEAAPTVRDAAYYHDDFKPVTRPTAPLIITYDWRSPVFFDLP